MKKFLFIIILASTFIPVPQTGASMGDASLSEKMKAKEAQLMVEQAPKSESNRESLLKQEKTNIEERISKRSINKQRSEKKKISSERRDRLFGLLLLAHGGQR